MDITPPGHGRLSPSWPGANSPMSGGSGNYNMGPSFNPQDMLQKMKANKTPFGGFRDVVNSARQQMQQQNPGLTAMGNSWANNIFQKFGGHQMPGQNPLTNMGRASGINFGPPPGMQNPMSQTNMPVNTPGQRMPQPTGPNPGGYTGPPPPSGYNPGITGGMNFGPTFKIPPIETGKGSPTPNTQGYYGGWQDESGLRHAGNEPGMSYML